MKEQLNGSAGRFAAALREVVRDAAQEAVAPLREDIAALKTEVAEVKGELTFARKRGELGATP